jgi:hypothetical protein
MHRALLRVGVILAIVAAVLTVGAANDVGPLAKVTPAAQVTDPGEMLARSLQAVIDASSVHVDATLAGQVPAVLLGRPAGVLRVDGTLATIDLRPQDARAQVQLSSPRLGLELEAITSWDTMAYRADAGTWTTGSFASLGSELGIDANPLTLVHQLRAWLAAPGAPIPVASTVSCDATSGMCRRVSMILGPDVGTVLKRLLPPGGASTVGAITGDLVVVTDASTLEPVRLTVAIRNTDASLALTLRLDFSLWNRPTVIADPPSS